MEIIDNITIGQIMTFLAYFITIGATILQVGKLFNKFSEELKKPIVDLSVKVDGLSDTVGTLKEANHQALRNTLLQSSSTYLARGWCSIEEKTTFDETYKVYEKLGENGFMKTRWEQVMSLSDKKINK